MEDNDDAERRREDHLLMYAVVRRDLDMPIGKLASQAGHAFTASLFECIDQHPEDAVRYRAGDNGGSKVTLYCRDLKELTDIAKRCATSGLPHAVFEDSGHILPPYFDGGPVITALGIGPVRRADAKPVVGKLKMV